MSCNCKKKASASQPISRQVVKNSASESKSRANNVEANKRSIIKRPVNWGHPLQ